MRGVIAALLVLIASGCGSAAVVSPHEPGPERPISLTCVKRIALRTAAVEAVDTAAPESGPAAGASRYVHVLFKNGGGSLALSEWHNEAAADTAAEKYQRIKPPLALGMSRPKTKPMILEAWTPTTAGIADIKAFKRCGLDQIE